MSKPKFRFGQTVFSKVQRRSSSEPCIAPAGSSFTVCGARQVGEVWVYECEAYDLYEFKESELMSAKEKADEFRKLAKELERKG